MNREQRRKLKKTKAFKDFDLNALLDVEQAMKDYKALEEGQTVQINVERILDRVENHGQNYTEEFLNWIKENSKKVFTVEYDDGMKDNHLVCLKEDKHNPKLLFWEGDLTTILKN